MSLKRAFHICLSVPLHVKYGRDAYLQCETLIKVYFLFLLIFWGIFHYIVLLILLFDTAYSADRGVGGLGVLSIVLVYKLRMEKKCGGGWLRGCTVQPEVFFRLFPWFFAGLWHHWAWVCVCICEVLFLLRLFIFPLLAVSVVVCPIIYLFCWCGLCIG